MSKRRKKSSPSPPPKPEPVAPGTLAGKSSGTLALRLLVAGILVAVAVAIPRLTLREARSELLLGKARAQLHAFPDSLKPETLLRQSYATDPHNPEALRELTQFMINKEKKHIQRGDYNLVEIENFVEASDMIERSQQIVPFRPSILRLRAETQMILSGLYTSSRQPEMAEESSNQAYEDFMTAHAMLPRFRDRGPDFDAAILLSALQVEREDVALDALHRIGRRQERGNLYDRGYAEEATIVWLQNGLYPQMAREVRYRLERQPRSPGLLTVFGSYARDLGLEHVVYRTLEDFDERGKLDVNGRLIMDAIGENMLGIEPRGSTDESS